MSIRTRLGALIAVMVAVAIALAALAADRSTRRELNGQLDDDLRQRTATIIRAFDARGAPRGPTIGRAPRLGSRSLLGFDAVVQLLDRSGNVIPLIEDQPTLSVDEIDRRIAAGEAVTQLDDEVIDGVPFRVLTSPAPNGGAVQVARDRSEVDAALKQLRNRFVLVAVVGAIVTALTGSLIVRRALKPISTLTDAAERVARTEDLATPIPVEREDEIGRLATSFNSMLAALDGSRRQQHDLVMDASHELRTPLTSLRTNVELLQRGAHMPEADRRVLLAATIEEVTELSTLVSELVELATDQRSTETPVSTDLRALAQSAADRIARRTQREIRLTGDDEANVTGRPAMLERAISNLVENAVKFSPADQPVDIEIIANRVQVSDRGPGIPETEKQRVFDRFYRSPGTSGAPGSGLGLAIVKQIAEAHGGRVWVTDAPGGGAIVGFDVDPGGSNDLR